MRVIGNIVIGAGYLVFIGAVLFAGAIIVSTWRVEGFWYVTEMLSPFNLSWYIPFLATLLPGVGLIWVGRKIKRAGDASAPNLG